MKVNDFVSGRIQPDYGEGELSLKDAYVRLSFDPAFKVTFGQFHRPFDVFELTSSTQTLVIERAGGVRGVESCAGPGGICSFSQFTEKLQFADRDIGIAVEGTDRTGRFSYLASVTNGTGANREDENGAKSFTGRLRVQAASKVAVAGFFGIHDYVDPASPGTDYATAFGGDVEIGDFARGLHIQFGVVGGENWRNLSASGPSTFVTTQGIASYKIPVRGNRFVTAVEPVGRVSWGDPDTDMADDDGILFTPGLAVFFAGRNKIAANADVWSPAAGSTEWSLKVQTYLHF